MKKRKNNSRKKTKKKIPQKNEKLTGKRKSYK